MQQQMFFQELRLSELKPGIDIIICNVYVGKMPPSKVKSFLEQTKKEINPFFEKHGFDVMYVPCRDAPQNTDIIPQDSITVQIDPSQLELLPIDANDTSASVEELIKIIDQFEAEEKYNQAKKDFDF